MFYLITLCGSSMLIYIWFTYIYNISFVYYYLKFTAVITLLKNKFTKQTKNKLYYVDEENLKIDSINNDGKILVSVNNSNNNWIESNIKFLFLEVYYHEHIYNITLGTVERTFYIVNNIINYNFIVWYLKNVANIKDINISDIHSVAIVDHQYKTVYLSKNEKLLIYESSYKLF